MPSLKTYRLFISHSWTYGDAYEKLSSFLDEADYFYWQDYSVPKDDPIHDAPNARLLEEAIRRQIMPTNSVLILAGVYSTYSKWINIELRLASEMNKPILAIQPWGAERTSSIVKQYATELVGWNTASIVGAIRRKAI